MKKYNYLPKLLPHQLEERAEDEYAKASDGMYIDDEIAQSAKEIRARAKIVRWMQWKRKLKSYKQNF